MKYTDKLAAPVQSERKAVESAVTRTLYICQKCGDEVGEGEQDRNGRHAYCGGQLDWIGECE